MTGVHEMEKSGIGIEMRPEHRGVAVLLIQYPIDLRGCRLQVGVLYQVHQCCGTRARGGDFAE